MFLSHAEHFFSNFRRERLAGGPPASILEGARRRATCLPPGATNARNVNIY